MGKFRLAGKNLWLTYPHCPLHQTVMIELLKEILHPILIDHYVVSREKHQDNTDHLHVGLWLNGRVDTRNAHFVDVSIGGENFHGNYQTMKKPRECAVYVMKDKDWVTDDQIWLDKLITLKKKTMDTIANLLTAGQTIREVAVLYPGLTMQHLTRLQQYQAWWTAGTWIPIPLPALNYSATGPAAAIMRWMALNLWNGARPLRSPQLYIQGLPGTGKSTLIQHLEKSFKTFKPSYSITWWDHFDDSFELIVFDEFKGQIRCTFMNQILDGQTLIIPRRHGDFTKTKNIPVIICSNFSPHSIYQNTDSVAAFVGRLKIIIVDNYFNIFFE